MIATINLKGKTICFALFILSILTGIGQPANDDGCGSSAFFKGTVAASGSTQEATQTLTNADDCAFISPNANKDVWYQFFAYSISSYTFKGNGVDGVIIIKRRLHHAMPYLIIT